MSRLRRLTFLKCIGLLATVAVCCGLLTGCWDYRGLNEQTIVAGMAIDVDDQSDGFLMTFETVDTNASPKEKVKHKLVDTRGPTYLEAIRNAVEDPYPKLYFSNTPVVIVSQLVAEKYGLSSLVDFIVRDDELRETMRIFVTKGFPAREIFLPDNQEESLLSYRLMDTIDNVGKFSGTNVDIRAFQIYNEINTKMDKSFVVPAINLEEDPYGKPFPTLDGGAIFKNNEFKGFFDVDFIKPYLIIRSELKGGVLSFDLDNNKNNDVVLEVLKCHTSKSYHYQDGQLSILMKPKLKLEISQLNLNMDLMDKTQVKKLKEDLQDILNTRLEGTVKTIQETYQADIFNFCHALKQKEPSLWNKIEDQWGELFPTIQVKAETEISIDNSGNIRSK